MLGPCQPQQMGTDKLGRGPAGRGLASALASPAVPALGRQAEASQVQSRLWTHSVFKTETLDRKAVCPGRGSRCGIAQATESSGKLSQSHDSPKTSEQGGAGSSEEAVPGF